MIFNASQLLESADEVQARVDGVYIKVVQHYAHSHTIHSHYTHIQMTLLLCVHCVHQICNDRNVKIHVDI